MHCVGTAVEKQESHAAQVELLIGTTTRKGSFLESLNIKVQAPLDLSIPLPATV